MSSLDWIILLGTLLFIVAYGTWKTRGNRNLNTYLKGGNSMKWATIGLSVMATQASAITFLSTPGQAFESGMAFVQNYFGMPLAIIIVCAVFIPIYYKLKVYTAYEFLEQRFDHKSRGLAALLFLIQRGLGAGITIYAPAIILSNVLELDLDLMIIIVGLLVVVYTVSGGTKAVSLTQKYQMGVIFTGMFLAFFILISKLPEFLSFGDALNVAGKLGKLEAIDFSFDIEKRYTFWSGITGGLFLSLSYFGADQSQVQRYLGGTNITQSRVGLIFNALLKIPMQFFILFVGVMVFVFYQFERPPVFFNTSEINALKGSGAYEEVSRLDDQYGILHEEKKKSIESLVQTYHTGDEAAISAKEDNLVRIHEEAVAVRKEVKDVLIRENSDANTKDSDYVFITFIMNYLPHGIIGLLLAVIFSAAMSSTSGELNALGSTTVVDFYKRYIRKKGSDKHYLQASRWITAIWGIIAILFALAAQLVENLIEFVNIVGSLFYGSILGIFMVAFFVKYVKGNAIFIAGILGQSFVLFIHILSSQGIIKIGYLWYNILGGLTVVGLSIIIQGLINTGKGRG
ncbi:MAG: sodium:solute symporter [Cyclobacteriaceae bacterium]|nr:sodium:solute symporter [Cyclobacteriaceae bacterium]